MEQPAQMIINSSAITGEQIASKEYQDPGSNQTFSKKEITELSRRRYNISGENVTTDPPLWYVPYTDQPLDFWHSLQSRFGDHIKSVYFPLPTSVIGSGRPVQPSKNLPELLRSALFSFSVLVNPICLPEPVDSLAPLVIEELLRLHDDYGIESVTVSNILLGDKIREKIPGLDISASTLIDICRPNQLLAIGRTCDSLVPSSRVVRDLPALKLLRQAFPGRIRLIVNEACLPGCPLRVQHFSEMGSVVFWPKSLCQELLSRQPWMRLTGSWILPQHLHLYEGVYDELKLAGRVTLNNPEYYLEILEAYVNNRHLTPDRLGGGPASVLEPIEISEEFFRQTLYCGHRCHECRICPDYYSEAMNRLERRQ